MTIRNLYVSGIVNDNTTVIIRDDDFHVITSGNWFEDNILNYQDREMEGFTWEKEDVIYIDILE